MGFNKVYKALQEIFPQIDARLLRAVAIEHNKDADAAVEAVLVEIIPFFTERPRPTTSLPGSTSVGESSEALVGSIGTTQTADGPSVNTVGSAEVKDGYNMNVGNQQSFHNADDGHNELFYGTSYAHQKGESNTAKLALSKRILEDSIETNIDVYSHDEAVELTYKDGVNTLKVEVSREPQTGETISADNIPCHALGTPQEVDAGINQNMNFFQDRADYNHSEPEFGKGTNRENDQAKACAGGNGSEIRPASLTIDDLTISPSECSSQLVVPPDMHGNNLEEFDISSSNNTASKMETTNNIVGTGDESALNASMSQSSQIHIIDVLEKIISDARNSKKTLFSAMQSVVSLIREVDIKEQAAAQAKLEAAMGGTDILAKVEELKIIIQHTEEHSGEVYGEKAILTTELKELQSHVLSLSDERDKSLAVLDQIHETLNVRLAAAENEIKSAEHEKLEKEKAALKALADQELIMEKVLQESQILKQQAEDNTRLQEFLVDRGHVVDMLQGEIAVICQDVRLLKEKFDEHIPLNKSLSSSQTSCILASSSSSLKSSTPEQVEPVCDGANSLETQEMSDPVSYSDERSSEEQAARDDDRKALLDDGWELFDDCEIFA